MAETEAPSSTVERPIKRKFCRAADTVRVPAGLWELIFNDCTHVTYYLLPQKCSYLLTRTSSAKALLDFSCLPMMMNSAISSFVLNFTRSFGHKN